MIPSSYNQRIAAKRQKACLDFLQTTSTNLSTAKHYLKQTAYDLDRAVSLFYDAGGESLPSDDESAQSQKEEDESRDQSSNNANDYDPITSIMNSAKEEKPISEEPAFSGRGFSLNSSAPLQNNESINKEPLQLKIRVTFYKDGFTAQEEEEEKDDANSRLRGVHSFSSSSVPRIPPLQTYEENPQFIKDVQNSQVPEEYRRLDAHNRPIPVSILLNDQRNGNYPIEIWEKQQRDDQSNPRSFSGSGQKLGGRDASAVNQTDKNEENSNVFARLLTLVIFLWRLLFSFITKWIRVTIPLDKHIVDHNKPTTNISLRMPHKRERVTFNVDHTIEDLTRYCRIELKTDGFELLAGFPPKSISINEKEKTLKEVGLLNSAVDVRIFSSGEEKRQN